MLKKYVSVVFLAATLAVAVAVGVSGVEPREVDASTYITVQTCTAGTIALLSNTYNDMLASCDGVNAFGRRCRERKG